jgi:hypothetical protein
MKDGWISCGYTTTCKLGVYLDKFKHDLKAYFLVNSYDIFLVSYLTAIIHVVFHYRDAIMTAENAENAEKTNVPDYLRDLIVSTGK